MKKRVDDLPPSMREFFADVDNPQASAKSFIEKYLRDLDPQNKNPSFGWILGKSGLPWLPLDIEFPSEEMLKEAKQVREDFVSHRSNEKEGYLEGNQGWKALCLHGISAKHTYDPIFNYGYKSERDVPYRWTEIAERCPETTKFFKNTYPCNEYYRVRYAALESGGYIYPHKDRLKSVLWEVNLALSNPPGFHFRIETGGYIPFSEDRAFILDVSGIHSTVNLSDEDRIHMIVHGNPIAEKGFRQLIERSFAKLLVNPQIFYDPNCK